MPGSAYCGVPAHQALANAPQPEAEVAPAAAVETNGDADVAEDEPLEDMPVGVSPETEPAEDEE